MRDNFHLFAARATLGALLFGVALSFGTTAAQAQRLQQQLSGKWEIDFQGSKELGPQAASAVEQLRVLEVQFSLEFTADGKFTVTHSVGGKQQGEKKGEWKVVKETEDRLFLDITNEGESSPSKMIIEFLFDGRIQLSPEKKRRDKDPTLVLKRVT